MPRPLVFLLIAATALAAGCRRELTRREAIERDLEERTMRELYAEAEGMRYSAPATGRLTQRQLDEYVRVRALAKEIEAVANERLDAKIEEASRAEGRFTRMAATFSGIGDARAALTAEVRAALMLKANPHELQWVKTQIGPAAMLLQVEKSLDAEIAAAKRALDAEPDDAKQDWLRRDVYEAERRKRHWLTTVDEVTLANADLLESNRTALAPHIRALQ